MARNILIGLGAGLAAALLFGGLVSGTALAFPLFMLSPLPIAIAGIGFGTWSGAAAAALAAALIGAVVGPLAGSLYLVLFGGPTAWTAHWIGLSREAPTPAGREWFPLEPILLRAALLVGGSVVAGGILLGFDPQAMLDTATASLETWLKEGGAGADAPTRAELEPFVRLNILMMPTVLAALSLGILILNSWLAARIAAVSGQFQRPWQPMWSVVLPTMAAPLFAVALAAAFMPGVIGQVGGAFAGVLGFAFALTGYGCTHVYLRGKPGRGPVLFLVYALSFIFTPAIVLMTAIGIADSLMQFRARRLDGPA